MSCLTEVVALKCLCTCVKRCAEIGVFLSAAIAVRAVRKDMLNMRKEQQRKRRRNGDIKVRVRFIWSG
jgi:hypothetical protein